MAVSPAAFVMPFYSAGAAPQDEVLLRHAVASALHQTDDNLRLVIVDDASPDPRSAVWLKELSASDPRIHVIRHQDNRGPGHCRNVGIRWAGKLGADIVCFLDSDDEAHPRRVEVARRLIAGTGADVVYSTFVVVDADGAEVPLPDIVSGVQIILRDLDSRPLSGKEIWIELAVDRDNLTIPSSLSVTTRLAQAVPFPEDVRFHEDMHTWLRYSASGAEILFTPDTPSRYRILTADRGSSSRERAGGIDAFNRLRANVISGGLREAIEMGVHRGVISNTDGAEILARYYLNVAGMIRREGSGAVAEELVGRARDLLSDQAYNRFRRHYQV
jgi:glycosyltransferase involved in cell wall biosynthesis